MKKVNIILAFMILACGAHVFAQRGYSSASVSMNRANGVTAPNQVIIEEYLNYHTHDIPLPKHKEEVALSLDYKNISKQSIALQVGLTTKPLRDHAQYPPVNVSIVIDKSGSMANGNKLQKVKKALSNFVDGLGQGDRVSIVAYSSEAKVILGSQKVEQITNLKDTINSLWHSGSTNLNNGLMTGYKEVKKYFNENHTNKVILLTDGIANTGLQDPDQIVKNSKAYNREGIDVFTIGVGENLNYTLLQKIAKAGKGSNHFVSDKQADINKVFDRELESLLYPIGKEVYLDLEYPEGMELNHIYGYEPECNKNQIRIPLKKMYSGLTQVVLLEFQLPDESMKAPVKANLEFFSYNAKTTKNIENTIEIRKAEPDYFSGGEVMKNYYIGEMAESLKAMARKVDSGEIDEGIDILKTSLEDIDKAYPGLNDEDIIRVKGVLEKNKNKLEDICRLQGLRRN